MNKIQTCIWLDTQAEEAARFYTSLFRDGQIGRTVAYGKVAAKASGQREGSVMIVELELAGSSFLALNGGPHFKPNPSQSFFVWCENEKQIDMLWAGLARETRMPLQKYPFLEKYGWCEDRYGVNWQLGLARSQQKIAPALLFANARFGKAEEAIRFYVEQFPGSRVERIAKDEKTGAVLHAVFSLAGQDFVAMEGPLPKEYDFSPAISFVIRCDSQEEIDTMWRRLSAVPQAERCGWLMDKFGVSWQIVHRDWNKMFGDASPDARDRLMAAILTMKKPDLAALEDALKK